jgi:hypothetical protein
MRGRARKTLVAVAAASLVAVPVLTGAGSATAIVAGAGFTTFDATLGGCIDGQHPNGIDCNNYNSKDAVYMSGGPSAAGLSDATYYFAVLTPGAQNGGFIDGAAGNLSDTTAGPTVGDAGSGDDVSNRTFTVTGHEISAYGGSHLQGTSPNGRAIIGLAPFDNTDNAGGVYILAICQTDATTPSQCKYDAFRIREDGTVTNFGVVSGGKYYDANENGQWDSNEAGIADWPINFSDGVSGTLTTGPDGNFSDTFVADDYTFAEVQAGSPWVQTGEVAPSQAQATGVGASVTLNSDKTYSVTVADDSTVSGLYFGNVCRVAPGGLTIGFWSNKNGQKLITSADLTALRAFHLVQPKKQSPYWADFDPTTAAQVSTWLLNATATNMAYMLSAQMAATYLNIQHGFTNGTTLVDGTTTVSQLITYADSLLAAHPYTVAAGVDRTEQERVKNILDKINNGGAFTQPTQDTCPDPVFATQ